ncbi:hypothetical protein E2C01_058594 [Portunus trituberculatus]|uniref:Uncharacterized protein n=1 Tax=Portunus trituberculatus TaxID=210409 RepID=A0A5B7H550_PORTR|nr:hypothetical protein [Portunus trituberculatus]
MFWQAILCGVGIQRKTPHTVAAELGIAHNIVMSQMHSLITDLTKQMIRAMILKLVRIVGWCGTKQQTLRDDAASRHDGSQGEDPVLNPMDCLKVVSGENRLRSPADH